MNNDGTAFVRILRFDQNTSQLLDQAADQMITDKAKGLVLDLRNDPGGYLDSAVGVSSEFIKEGLDCKDMAKAGKTVNPHGLTLMKVEY